ncbi:hypothetical protein GCM10010145_51620 [Streptomyces ruber]|uniref:Alpha/beta hydrolase n=2 Tax=Streptomyces TaxID=1883 RepID=A0A918EUT7_9ACTN|nr:hypothetical protein [Streptomyces ruber]GGQ75662.1 hypothetical protein GCM10010145_51620 [Streptomyces ruber]
MTVPGGEPATFVYVHGAGNKPPEAELKLAWDHDLFQRDMGARSRMVYYADTLHDRPAAIAVDACAADGALEALVADAMAGEFPLRDASAGPSPVEAGADAQSFALSLTISMAARAASPAGSLPVAATQPGTTASAALLPLPGPLRRFLLEQLLRTFVPDAEAYFFTGARGRIQDRLRGALDAVEGPVVVVAHSLGTVVAYDVLGEERFAGADIPLFVTLGSPLGYTEIQDVVARPLRVPAPVRLWANFADPFDLVTLDTTLADDFRGSANRIADVQVDNRSPSNHAACGYLRTAAVRGAASAATGERPAAPGPEPPTG